MNLFVSNGGNSGNGSDDPSNTLKRQMIATYQMVEQQKKDRKKTVDQYSRKHKKHLKFKDYLILQRDKFEGGF